MILTIALSTKVCGVQLQCLCFENREISYYSAYLGGLLMVIGSVLAVIFKLLSCRTIDDGVTVHYYYGNKECFDGLWILSLCGLIIIGVVWCIFDVLLWRMHDERQRKIENNLFTLVKDYKPAYWYWESVLLSRRLIVALFAIANDVNNILNDTMTILLCIFLILQVWKQPFKYKRVNRLESVCILILITVVTFVNNDYVDRSMLWGIFLFICILLPILFVFYEFFGMCMHYMIDPTEIPKEKIRKIELRRLTNTPMIRNSGNDLDESYETDEDGHDEDNLIAVDGTIENDVEISSDTEVNPYDTDQRRLSTKSEP
eukprot:17022_1